MKGLPDFRKDWKTVLRVGWGRLPVGRIQGAGSATLLAVDSLIQKGIAAGESQAHTSE